MSLVLDHINGVPDDHRLENLRIVCPNCNATLDTHCGHNIPRLRECAGCGSAFAQQNMQHRYCSKDCWERVHVGLGRGIPHPEARKVERPPYEQLIAEVQASNFCAVARKYGVTDNAVRKWVRFYERQREREAEEGA